MTTIGRVEAIRDRVRNVASKDIGVHDHELLAVFDVLDVMTADAMRMRTAAVVAIKACAIESLNVDGCPVCGPLSQALTGKPSVDLLEAVRHLAECKHDEPLGLYGVRACRKCIDARAVLVRYGLLE